MAFGKIIPAEPPGVNDIPIQDPCFGVNRLEVFQPFLGFAGKGSKVPDKLRPFLFRYPDKIAVGLNQVDRMEQHVFGFRNGIEKQYRVPGIHFPCFDPFDLGDFHLFQVLDNMIPVFY